jgi:hypothetical protein
MSAVEDRILDIYVRADAQYKQLAPSLGSAALGYEVLYGPPIVDAPALFIGYQPGGSKPGEPLPTISGPGGRSPWPDTCEYAAGSFCLARKLQVAFGADFLRRCTGMNAIFLRAPSQTAYKTVPISIRTEFEALSIAANQHVVTLLRPRIIVTIGFSTLNLFGSKSNDVVKRADGRALVAEGAITSVPALAMWHPTSPGKRPNDDDLRSIGSFVLGRLAGAS